MSNDYRDKTACVVDFGPFQSFADRLAEDFGRTLLYVPWETTMPKSDTLQIGVGLPGVEKVDAIWPHLSDIDLFVFPDIHHGALQEYLVSIGKRVWGSRMGEELEVFRDYQKQVFKDAGAPIAPYVVLKGLTALRAHLKKHEDQYVKVNRARADCETFHAESYRLAEPRLDALAHGLGPRAETIEFIVEDSIPDAIEIAWDGYTVDGQFPARSLVGIETKDKGYVGCMQEWGDVFEGLRELNAIAAPMLKAYGYRNFWSMEARITKDGTPWLIDPCARAGSPPHEVELLEYTNLSDILWYGAEGELVDPVPAGPWVCQVQLRSDAPPETWQCVEIPPEHERAVKLHFRARINERDYVTPVGVKQGIIGSVCATGETLEAVKEEIGEIAGSLKGCYLDAPLHALDDAEKHIEDLQEFHITLAPSEVSAA